MFGNGKTKEEKQQEQLEKFKERYHLDELDPKDLDTVQAIASDLAGNGFLKAGIIFGGNAADQAKTTYLSALVQQNWLIINQMNRLNKNIEELKNK